MASLHPFVVTVQVTIDIDLCVAAPVYACAWDMTMWAYRGGVAWGRGAVGKSCQCCHYAECGTGVASRASQTEEHPTDGIAHVRVSGCICALKGTCSHTVFTCAYNASSDSRTAFIYSHTVVTCSHDAWRGGMRGCSRAYSRVGWRWDGGRRVNDAVHALVVHMQQLSDEADEEEAERHRLRAYVVDHMSQRDGAWVWCVWSRVWVCIECSDASGYTDITLCGSVCLRICAGPHAADASTLEVQAAHKTVAGDDRKHPELAGLTKDRLYDYHSCSPVGVRGEGTCGAGIFKI